MIGLLTFFNLKFILYKYSLGTGFYWISPHSVVCKITFVCGGGGFYYNGWVRIHEPYHSTGFVSRNGQNLSAITFMVFDWNIHPTLRVFEHWPWNWLLVAGPVRKSTPFFIVSHLKQAAEGTCASLAINTVYTHYTICFNFDLKYPSNIWNWYQSTNIKVK